MRADVRAAAIALFASQGAFLFGLDIGYIAPILECAPFKRDVAKLPDWQNVDSAISSAEVGLIVSVFSVGCLCTSLPFISRYFLDVWGRRDSIIIGDIVFLCGCAAQATAASLSQMILGRFVTGCSIGLLSAVIALYQSEIAPPGMRGGLTSVYQLMITFGILVAAFLDSLLVNGDDGWRAAIWLQALPAIALLCGMPLLPRSPRWLVQNGREEEALTVLNWLRGEDAAVKELADIQASFSEDVAASEGAAEHWTDVFVGRTGRLLAVGVTLQLLQQLVGMNCFMYFGPRVFRSLELDENFFQTMMNAVNFVASIPAVILADRCGRRSLLAWSATGMTIACVIMGLLGLMSVRRTASGWRSSSEPAGVVMVFVVACFIANFAYGWGPMVWVYCAEMFPMRFRSRCLGWTTACNWLGNFLIARCAGSSRPSCWSPSVSLLSLSSPASRPEALLWRCGSLRRKACRWRQ
eukprot:TRINITY_DN47677_c0_g1_i1.p1 TRINITY_DN47677_c0_g1~~TRINITY_DN47677_c0_g1_i1.p1  ORF type:complete len:467 (-),score=58.71 TRINITY_DN47677_c0_g1_i1:300-1700(-)